MSWIQLPGSGAAGWAGETAYLWHVANPRDRNCEVTIHLAAVAHALP